MLPTLPIVPIREEHIDSFWRAIDTVAREGRYLLMTEGPPIASTQDFVRGNIQGGVLQLVALDGDEVVAWVDVSPSKRKGIDHYGTLGIGVLPAYRGRGLGRRLMLAALEGAKARGLEAVRLDVFASNARAHALYTQVGFVEEGVRRRARKHEGRYDDIIQMVYHFDEPEGSRTYSRSAELYDEIYDFKNYRNEADKVRALIQARRPQARRLLDVACGSGEHARYLAEAFEVDGLDQERGFEPAFRRKLPGRPFHVADMADFSLSGRYDVITCLFSAIGFVRTRDRLAATFAAFARHLTPGGLVIVEPWFEPWQWTPGRINLRVVDQPDRKVCRLSVSQRAGDESVLREHFLVATRDGVEHFTEDFAAGLFSRADVTSALTAAGLIVDYEAEGLMGRGLYVAELR